MLASSSSIELRLISFFQCEIVNTNNRRQQVQKGSFMELKLLWNNIQSSFLFYFPPSHFATLFCMSLLFSLLLPFCQSTIAHFSLLLMLPLSLFYLFYPLSSSVSLFLSLLVRVCHFGVSITLTPLMTSSSSMYVQLLNGVTN